MDQSDQINWMLGAEIAALVTARDRMWGDPHVGERDAAERCCGKGWLESSGQGSESDGLPIYLLTEAGKTELRRLGLPTTRQDSV